MTDDPKDTLAKVAKGYNDLLTLQIQQRATQAKLIRACVAAIQRQPTSFDDSAKRRRIASERVVAFRHLEILAEMLETAK